MQYEGGHEGNKLVLQLLEYLKPACSFLAEAPIISDQLE